MRVVKRTIKNQTYYYLQHTWREKGNVKTKELYLGKQLPKDLKEQEEHFLSEVRKPLYHKLDQIKKNFQQEWKRMPVSVKEQQLQEISIAFTYHTNAIEGSTITLPETRTIIKDQQAPSKPLNDVKETEAHNAIFHEILLEKKDITEALLLHWHTTLFKDTQPELAGRYRDYLVRVGSHLQPDWQDIPKLMKQFITFLKKDEHPVEQAAKAHYHFEHIHPFGDGNGRIGRLLMNHILWHAGFPMLIIEKSNRKSYYHALRNEEAFVKYFFRRYFNVHKKFQNQSA